MNANQPRALYLADVLCSGFECDQEQVPSRFADHRKWRDGRVEMTQDEQA